MRSSSNFFARFNNTLQILGLKVKINMKHKLKETKLKIFLDDLIVFGFIIEVRQAPKRMDE